MNGLLERTFRLSKNHTNVKTEVLAGITTFMTMAYILAVNPSVLRGIHCNGAGILSGNTDDGCLFQLPLCTGTRYGFERILCLHSCRADGLHMACGTGSSICGRDYFHHTFPDKCA